MSLAKQRETQKQTQNTTLTVFPSDIEVISNLLCAPFVRSTPLRFAAFKITFLASLIFPFARSHLTDSGSSLSEHEMKNRKDPRCRDCLNARCSGCSLYHLYIAYCPLFYLCFILVERPVGIQREIIPCHHPLSPLLLSFIPFLHLYSLHVLLNAS